MPNTTRTWEVRAIDDEMNVWIFATEDRDRAEQVEREFTEKGYKDVELVEAKHAPRT